MVDVDFEVLRGSRPGLVTVIVLFWYLVVLGGGGGLTVVTGPVDKSVLTLTDLLMTVLYSALIVLTLPASSSVRLPVLPAVVPALLPTDLTEGSWIVMEDLLGQREGEGVGVLGTGAVQEVQVLLRRGLEGLGQPEGEVGVLAMEDPGGLLLHPVMEQETGGRGRARAWQRSREWQLRQH